MNQIQDTLKTLATKQEFNKIKDEVYAIHIALTHTNHGIADQEQRTTFLERAA